MKFAVGDIVSYIDAARHGTLVSSFSSRWGYGPFEIIEMTRTHCYFNTLQGEPVVQYPSTTRWSHRLDNLELETFLTAARKAIDAATRTT